MAQTEGVVEVTILVTVLLIIVILHKSLPEVQIQKKIKVIKITVIKRHKTGKKVTLNQTLAKVLGLYQTKAVKVVIKTKISL